MLEHKIRDENSVFLNAAIALQTIAGQHPFVNGNKRTGIANAIVILRNEEYRLTINDKTDFIVAVATPEKNLSIEEIVDWMTENFVLVESKLRWRTPQQASGVFDLNKNAIDECQLRTLDVDCKETQYEYKKAKIIDYVGFRIGQTQDIQSK